jgi:hypothetical protein
MHHYQNIVQLIDIIHLVSLFVVEAEDGGYKAGEQVTQDVEDPGTESYQARYCCVVSIICFFR